MASSLKNLSEHDPNKIPSAKKMRFGIVVSEWNTEITEALLDGCYQSLIEHGADSKNIVKKYVPGSFELTLGAQFLAAEKNIDVVICLGCVIQGETRHFDFICDAVANGITHVSLKYNKPVIFGVLTPNTQKQAWERSGGKHGNKGVEAAVTAIKMVALQATSK
ncbi:MAG: 6,7-dimethyl-8-ribityllumazine synthase [Bacteroidetes bacterium]|nr:6,7-dimethyl-8-ribityllumazine synthase [Bacteroidota bacterium]